MYYDVSWSIIKKEILIFTIVVHKIIPSKHLTISQKLSFFLSGYPIRADAPTNHVIRYKLCTVLKESFLIWNESCCPPEYDVIQKLITLNIFFIFTFNILHMQSLFVRALLWHCMEECWLPIYFWPGQSILYSLKSINQNKTPPQFEIFIRVYHIYLMIWHDFLDNLR